MLTTQSALSDLLQRIRAEYHESPGMSLTKAQVQRLWNLDASTCDTLLGHLLDTGFLRRTRSNGYVRADY
jgi:hypothetical protein